MKVESAKCKVESDYLGAAGFANFAASIGTFTWTSVSSIFSKPSTECFFYPGWERQLGVQLDAIQLACSQRQHRHWSVRRGDPSGAAVVGRRAVAVQRVDDRGSQAWSPGEDLDRARALRPVARARSLRDNAGEAGHPLRSAKRGDVLVENLDRGRSVASRLNQIVRLVQRRRSIQQGETWCDPGAIAAAMARVAGHDLPSPEAG